ncbi:AGE family epimerase/isomerase [Bacteroides sp. GD17]|uniref:AGE family epimerase/isomerase n=1 Tax=Bacteroides sp. GD17 TaxID=3139826 RepID=UPI0025D90900|nr:AGE family epimerase/isomerase [uncultured Bacteroides sp.]
MKKVIYLFALFIGLNLYGCKSEQVNLSSTLRSEVVADIKNDVLPFWMNYAVAADGGFYGSVLRDGTPVEDAPRGGVLNARILWSFSAAYRTFKDDAYLKLADQSQRYFIDTFIDKVNGGVYWLVNPNGEVLNASKYTYAMTYAIYGLAEHYLATGNDESLQTAISLYRTLEEKGRDPQNDGYVESFTEDWKLLDMYDNNAPKTMNAHLHVLEAYALLYQCWQDSGLKQRLKFCVDLFMNRIYDPQRKHFKLFFDNEWNSLVEMDSYGHDVETGWLLCDAAHVLGDQVLIDKADQIALDVTKTCLAEGMSEKGYMTYEKKGGKASKHCSWWGQIETMIACINAWQISGDESYLHAADTVWTFVKQNMIDTEYGEWYSDCFDGKPGKDAPKVSMWRCPYHTVRLGVEMYNRLK